jgi:hypothetical protein
MRRSKGRTDLYLLWLFLAWASEPSSFTLGVIQEQLHFTKKFYGKLGDGSPELNPSPPGTEKPDLPCRRNWVAFCSSSKCFCFFNMS